MSYEENLMKAGRREINLDNEEEFVQSYIGKVFKMIFKDDHEIAIIFKFLKVIKSNIKGFRVYGNQVKLCKYLGISAPYFYKLKKKLLELGIIEEVNYPHPLAIKTNLPKNETNLNEDIALYSERRSKSKFLILSSSTKFVNTLSNAIYQWIKFRKPSLVAEMIVEDEEEPIF